MTITPSKYYSTGVPCKHGHVAPRLISNRACTECTLLKRAARHQVYYAKHKEAIKARTRENWRTSPTVKIKDKALRDKNREKIRAYDRMRAKRDKAKKKIIYDRWVKNNPERNRMISIATQHRRRVRLKQAGGLWNADDIKRSLKAQKQKCWWCQGKLTKGYHVDHRFPIAKDGTNEVSNIVISCAPCNQAKGVKMPWEFAGRLL